MSVGTRRPEGGNNMSLKMDLVEAVPETKGRPLSPEMTAILERAAALKDGEILRVDGLFADGVRDSGGRLGTIRKRGFHAASRKQNGTIMVYIWRK